jgi:hypothetical protein
MEISELDNLFVGEYLITDEMPVAEGRTLRVTFDANKFTGALYRRMAEFCRARQSEFEQAAEPQPEPRSLADVMVQTARRLDFSATVEDVDREMYADALASDRYGVLRAWGVTDGGRSVEPTFDVLRGYPSPRLRALYEWCREEARPKKAKTEPGTMTAASTNDGSPAPDTPTPASPSTLTSTGSPASST